MRPDKRTPRDVTKLVTGLAFGRLGVGRFASLRRGGIFGLRKTGDSVFGDRRGGFFDVGGGDFRLGDGWLGNGFCFGDRNDFCHDGFGLGGRSFRSGSFGSGSSLSNRLARIELPNCSDVMYS